jgi:HD-GYP domain-containing protein (c-di-GMP phosphodiesterase class II)
VSSVVISVADTYDLLTHTRVYRDAISPADAIQELCRCSGTQFDPAVVEALMKALGKQTLH